MTNITLLGSTTSRHKTFSYIICRQIISQQSWVSKPIRPTPGSLLGGRGRPPPGRRSCWRRWRWRCPRPAAASTSVLPEDGRAQPPTRRQAGSQLQRVVEVGGNDKYRDSRSEDAAGESTQGTQGGEEPRADHDGNQEVERGQAELTQLITNTISSVSKIWSIFCIFLCNYEYRDRSTSLPYPDLLHLFISINSICTISPFCMVVEFHCW